MEKITLQVKGMSCVHCEKAVVEAVTDLGATDVVASAKNNTVVFTYNPTILPLEDIKEELTDMGYDN